jgi:hypothetical protein
VSGCGCSQQREVKHRRQRALLCIAGADPHAVVPWRNVFQVITESILRAGVEFDPRATGESHDGVVFDPVFRSWFITYEPCGGRGVSASLKFDPPKRASRLIFNPIVATTLAAKKNYSVADL